MIYLRNPNEFWFFSKASHNTFDFMFLKQCLLRKECHLRATEISLRLFIMIGPYVKAVFFEVKLERNERRGTDYVALIFLNFGFMSGWMVVICLLIITGSECYDPLKLWSFSLIHSSIKRSYRITWHNSPFNMRFSRCQLKNPTNFADIKII